MKHKELCQYLFVYFTVSSENIFFLHSLTKAGNHLPQESSSVMVIYTLPVCYIPICTQILIDFSVNLVYQMTEEGIA